MQRRLVLVALLVVSPSALARTHTTQEIFTALNNAQVFQKPGWKMYILADEDRVTFDIPKFIKQMKLQNNNPKFTGALEMTQFQVGYQYGNIETSYTAEIITYKSPVAALSAQKHGKYGKSDIVFNHADFNVVIRPLYGHSDLKPVFQDMQRVFVTLK